jgi:hypothetical protein
VNLSSGISFQIGDLLTLGCALLVCCQIVTTVFLAGRMEATVIVFLQFCGAGGLGDFDVPF